MGGKPMRVNSNNCKNGNMNVAFVNIINLPVKLPYAPLGLCSICGYIKNNFHNQVEPYIFDMQLMTVNEIVKSVLEIKPRILGFSLPIGTHITLKIILEKLLCEIPDEQMPFLVFGKSFPTTEPEFLLKQYPEAICAIGEGEIAVHDLIEYVQGFRQLDEVRNIVFLRNNNIIHTSRGRLTDLSLLGLPDYSQLKQILDLGGVAEMETGRGCPWGHCTFCSVHIFWGQPTWKHKMVDNVIQELQIFKKYGVEKINIVDEEFLGCTAEQIEERKDFIKAIVAGNPNIKFSLNARVDAIYRTEDDEILAQKKREQFELVLKMGVAWLFLGIESGSDSQLARYGKGVNRADIEGALKMINEYGIHFLIGFIMFDALVTKKELIENIEFIKRNNLLKYLHSPLNKMRVYKNIPYLKLVRDFEKKAGKKLLGEYDLDTLEYNISEFADICVDRIFQICHVFAKSYNFFFREVKQKGMYETKTTYLACYYESLKEVEIALMQALLELSDSELAAVCQEHDILKNAVQQRDEIVKMTIQDIINHGHKDVLAGLLEECKKILVSGKTFPPKHITWIDFGGWRSYWFKAIGIQTLAGYIETNYNGQLFQDIFYYNPEQITDLLEHLDKNNPDYVCFSVNPMYLKQAMDLARKICALINSNPDLSNLKLVFGNKGIAGQENTILSEFPNMLVVTNEGEEALLEIINNTEPRFIPNLWYTDESGAVSFTYTQVLAAEKYCAPKDDIQHINDQPLPLYKELGHVEGIRDCYKAQSAPCTFCLNSCKRENMPKNQWRLLKVSETLKAIESEVKSGCKTINIVAEDFIGEGGDSIKPLIDGIGRLKEQGRIGRDITFYTSIKTTDVYSSKASRSENDQKISFLLTLKEFGFTTFYVGMESVSDNQLKRYGKGITALENKKASQLLKQLDFNIDGVFLMVDPLMNLDDFIINAEFLLSCQVPKLMLYPFNKLIVFRDTAYAKMVSKIKQDEKTEKFINIIARIEEKIPYFSLEVFLQRLRLLYFVNKDKIKIKEYEGILCRHGKLCLSFGCDLVRHIQKGSHNAVIDELVCVFLNQYNEFFNEFYWWAKFEIPEMFDETIYSSPYVTHKIGRSQGNAPFVPDIVLCNFEIYDKLDVPLNKEESGINIDSYVNMRIPERIIDEVCAGSSLIELHLGLRDSTHKWLDECSESGKGVTGIPPNHENLKGRWFCVDYDGKKTYVLDNIHGMTDCSNYLSMLKYKQIPRTKIFVRDFRIDYRELYHHALSDYEDEIECCVCCYDINKRAGDVSAINDNMQSIEIKQDGLHAIVLECNSKAILFIDIATSGFGSHIAKILDYLTDTPANHGLNVKNIIFLGYCGSVCRTHRLNDIILYDKIYDWNMQDVSMPKNAAKVALLTSLLNQDSLNDEEIISVHTADGISVNALCCEKMSDIEKWRNRNIGFAEMELAHIGKLLNEQSRQNDIQFQAVLTITDLIGEKEEYRLGIGMGIPSTVDKNKSKRINKVISQYIFDSFIAFNV